MFWGPFLSFRAPGFLSSLLYATSGCISPVHSQSLVQLNSAAHILIYWLQNCSNQAYFMCLSESLELSARNILRSFSASPPSSHSFFHLYRIDSALRLFRSRSSSLLKNIACHSRYGPISTCWMYHAIVWLQARSRTDFNHLKRDVEIEREMSGVDKVVPINIMYAQQWTRTYIGIPCASAFVTLFYPQCLRIHPVA
ncbi:hypothetical protein JB92DRAFT_516815 [Gautieria morchelliformis]|nr:hypothetical protein JB92DRAFT_516815 [Gautieria morchelliformis]